MSGLILVAFTLVAVAAFALAIFVLLVRRPTFGRLVLVALLTRVFDRPAARSPASAGLSDRPARP